MMNQAGAILITLTFAAEAHAQSVTEPAIPTVPDGPRFSACNFYRF